jgi:hypothetical protein
MRGKTREPENPSHDVKKDVFIKNFYAISTEGRTECVINESPIL